MDKNVEIGWLMDFYADFLTPRQRLFLDLHFNQDFSLSEIAEQEGISRQGVHDALKRGETALYEYEERLGLMRRTKETTEKLVRIRHKLSALPIGQDDPQFASIVTDLDGIIAAWEDGHGI